MTLVVSLKTSISGPPHAEATRVRNRVRAMVLYPLDATRMTCQDDRSLDLAVRIIAAQQIVGAYNAQSRGTLIHFACMVGQLLELAGAEKGVGGDVSPAPAAPIEESD